jgi:hypothetical protein
LYLSTAAHCFEGKAVGAKVTVAGEYAARLAFVMSNGFNADFALVELNNSYRDEIHPATYYWGGPTGVVQAVGVGDEVLTYGNSVWRDPSRLADADQPAVGDRLDSREGVVNSPEGNETEAYFLPPSTPGDSGSPVLTRSGKALGILTSFRVSGSLCAGCNGIWNVAPSLEAARQAGLSIELVTWPMLQDPVIPSPDTPEEGGRPASP